MGNSGKMNGLHRGSDKLFVLKFKQNILFSGVYHALLKPRQDQNNVRADRLAIPTGQRTVHHA